MGILDGVTTSDLFVTAVQQQAILEQYANQALQTGIDLYTKEDYEGAAKAFQRAISINPTSDNVVQATQYLSQSYLELDQTDKAIAAYQNILKTNHDNASLYLELGNILYSEERYEEAASAYRSAVNIDSTDSTAQYSYGKSLIQLGKYNQAKEAFNAVIRLEPDSSYGYLGLGETYAAEEDYTAAIAQYEKAIEKDPEDYEAYVELGYVYADTDQIEEARELVTFLEGKDEDLSALLDAYIDKVEKPQMVLAWGSSTFTYSLSSNTALTSLDSYFETANTSITFTVKILFSKEMDQSSVENIANWEISRASSSNLAETYNYGDEISETEVSINSIPNFVLYDEDTLTATIGFTITQNSTADGTIDPSHIVFKFSGEDEYGIEMDADYDEFSGFSGVA